MTSITHLPWRNEQEAGNYPFSDTATLTSDAGIAFLPNTFLDAHLYPIGAHAGLYITKVAVTAGRVRLYVGTAANDELCSVEFNPLSPPQLLQLKDAYERPAGVLLTAELGLSLAQSWPTGTYTFTRAATEFVASVCCPMPEQGLQALATERGEILSGDVWLVGENGVVVREDPDVFIAGEAVVRVDIVGDPLFRRALCQAEADSPDGPVPLFAAPRFLKTINGLPPDEYGRFVINVGTAAADDPVLRITPTQDGLLLKIVGQSLGS